MRFPRSSLWPRSSSDDVGRYKGLRITRAYERPSHSVRASRIPRMDRHLRRHPLVLDHPDDEVVARLFCLAAAKQKLRVSLDLCFREVMEAEVVVETDPVNVPTGEQTDSFVVRPHPRPLTFSWCWPDVVV